jgi:hypothetical protein
MAHRGHNYPVHFRRDFNLNSSTNNNGFAKGYNHDFQQAIGTIGQALHGHPLVMVAYDESTFNGMRWKSPVVAAGGHYVHFECTTVFPASPADIRIEGQLIDESLGPLGDAVAGFLDQFFYRSFNFHWVPFSFPYGDLFGMSTSSFTTCGAVLWQQWNNL